MGEVKLLHMADLHLDTSFASLGGDAAAARHRTEELKESFTRIIDLCRREEVQLLLAAGDLFEARSVRKGTIKFIDDELRRLSGTRVFISPGNHDPNTATSYYRSYAWAPNVHIFGPRWEEVGLPELGVTVYGYGYDRPEVTEPLLRSLRVREPGRINLAVVHASSTLGGGDGFAPYLPFNPAEVDAAGVDYLALGHYHHHSVVRQAGGRVTAQYPGSPESLDFGQRGPHGVILGAIRKDGSSLRLVPVGRREHRGAVVDVTGASTLQEVRDRVLAAVAAERRRVDLFRITLTGTVEEALEIDPLELSASLCGEFYYLRILDETTPDCDLDRLVQEPGARGLFVRRLRDRLALLDSRLVRETAASGDSTDAGVTGGPADKGGAANEALLVRRALAYGLEAFRGRVNRR